MRFDNLGLVWFHRWGWCGRGDRLHGLVGDRLGRLGLLLLFLLCLSLGLTG